MLCNPIERFLVHMMFSMLILTKLNVQLGGVWYSYMVLANSEHVDFISAILQPADNGLFVAMFRDVRSDQWRFQS